MFDRSYKIATVWGIPIKVHISLILLLLYVAFKLLASGLGALAFLMLMAELILFEALVFTSIALHELGHSFVALRKNCQVKEITLTLIGGVAQMTRMPRRPRDELLMAVAGPAVSLALGALLWFGGGWLVFLRMYELPVPFTRHVFVYCNWVQLVGLINWILALFNLLPAFPMDGGRVLRAALTPRHGRLKATFIASRLGQVVAIIFIVIGLANGRLMPGLIGIFILWAGPKEYRHVAQQERFRSTGYAPWEGDDDLVRISPPPYAEGRETRTDIHTVDR